MSDLTNGFHHIEFHTIQPDYLIDLFVRVYGFQLIAQRITSNYSQWFLRSFKCQLLISSISNSDISDGIESQKDDYDILTSIIQNEVTREYILGRDTVFNIAIHVKSIQSILDKNADLQIIVSQRQAIDEYGSIEYACIKSCIGNVVHTLIDTSHYSGPCLPGFTSITTSKQQGDVESITSDIDHIAFAIEKESALSNVVWYEKVFAMKRFFINQADDPFQGFTVRVGTQGMRLFASEYWKCAATACIHETKSNMKLVFAESLIDSDSGLSDQITRFIVQHKNQAGIQHLGLTCMHNIKDAVRMTKMNGAQFLSPLPSYYLHANNGHLIEEAGESILELADLGILLDDEADASTKVQSNRKILLQIFTKSIFNNDTFFLELIERRGAIGFGAGNIRTLWKIVQQQMNYRA